MSNYWNPNNPISVPQTIPFGTPLPAPDPQVRIANALERIALALESANARHSVTVAPTFKKPAIRKAPKARRRG